VSRADASHLSESDLSAILPRFRGKILQIPPMVSAVHHEGKRLYELARKGIEVERAVREVDILKLELTCFSAGDPPAATLEIECSSGTYIRSLAADIGAALGVGAHMTSLRRTRAGTSSIDEAHTLEELEQRKSNGTLAVTMISIAQALRRWPHVTLESDEI